MFLKTSFPPQFLPKHYLPTFPPKEQKKPRSWNWNYYYFFHISSFCDDSILWIITTLSSKQVLENACLHHKPNPSVKVIMDFPHPESILILWLTKRNSQLGANNPWTWAKWSHLLSNNEISSQKLWKQWLPYFQYMLQGFIILNDQSHDIYGSRLNK